jgi:hypothetical protein
MEIAEFIHEWRAAHPDQTDIESAIAAAGEHFGLGDRAVWNVWKTFGSKGKRYWR